MRLRLAAAAAFLLLAGELAVGWNDFSAFASLKGHAFRRAVPAPPLLLPSGFQPARDSLFMGSQLAGGSPQPANHSPEFRAMQQKIEHLKQNAAKAKPDPKPTEITEAEANAYFAEGGVKLPKGVSRVHLTSQPGVLDAHASVDFEAIMQGKGSSNPLIGLFSGTHDVHMVAQASGAAGMGSIRVQSVYIDGLELPQMALQFFAQHFITPRYPNVGVTTTFKLPLRIDSAVIEAGRVRLEQK